MKKIICTVIALAVLGLGGLSAVFISGEYALEKAEALQKEDTKKFQEIYNLVLDKKWDAVRDMVRDFVRTFPQSAYIDDAWYWDTYALEKAGLAAEKAVERYKWFIDRYPRSNWVDDAQSSLVRLATRLSERGLKRYEAVIESIRDSREDSIKLQALYALADSGDPGSLETVIGLYDRSEDPGVKRRILFLLGEFESPEAFRKVRDIIQKEKDAGLQRMAVFALTEFDSREKEVVKTLQELLQSESGSDVKRAAIHALSEVDSPDTGKILMDIALKGKDEKLARVAVYALSDYVEDREFLNVISRILRESKYPEVKRAALHVMGGSDLPEVAELLKNTILKEKDTRLRRDAIYVLADEATDDSLKVLMQVLDSETDRELKGAALNVLGEYGDRTEVRKRLLAVARGKDEQLARRAVYALAEGLKKEEGAQLLEIYRKTPHAAVRRAVLHALMENDDEGEDMTAVLFELFDGETDARLKRMMIFSLADRESDRVVDFLTKQALEGEDYPVRQAAVAVLGEMDTPGARKALKKILENEK